MFQRNIPDWESFKFRITCFDTTFVFVIKLGKAGCHFSASWSRGSNDNQRSCCFNIVILTISFVTYDKGSIIWITRNQIKHINFDSKLFKTFLECVCTFLSGILSDADTSYIKTALCEYFHKAEYIFIISDTKVTSDFIFINVSCADYDDNLCLIRKLHQHGMECVMEFFFPKGTDQNLILAALRFWVREYHVDGFHLLGENLPMTAIAQDKRLSRTKIFYTDFGDAGEKERSYRNLYVYKDEYQYPARKMLNHFGYDLDEFIDQQRKQGSVLGFVNYISDNNGFTLADLFMYNERHNEDNGENNCDGNAWNFSNNYGVEGPTAKRYINRLRKRQWRNAILMIMMAQGVPLLWSGDEFGNSQAGNNS